MPPLVDDGLVDHTGHELLLLPVLAEIELINGNIDSPVSFRVCDAAVEFLLEFGNVGRFGILLGKATASARASVDGIVGSYRSFRQLVFVDHVPVTCGHLIVSLDCGVPR